MRSVVDSRILRGLDAEFIESDLPVLRETKHQLEQYFRAERKQFELPLLLIGSDFQKRVWDELILVGYGDTASYLDLAERMGNKNAVRAVASANGANAIAIIVPCHRIIGSKGELVGYAGGLRAKQKLLESERGLFALS
ncbi:MAG TPA: methylated-DNA--[protein]-cysteine S-methyltransferase [Arenimonas sp.]|nr:methylated-DNA--[protein]-cysteine S-methyltransferase [Arenimonas sp.]